MFKESNAQLDILLHSGGYVDNTFWRTAATNCYRSKWYTAALFCLDKAIMACEPAWFSELSKLYYFRGKVITKLITNSSSVAFPISFQVTKPKDQTIDFPEYLTKSPAVPVQKQTVFRCVGDLIQEGGHTFKQAQLYAENVSDEVRLGKTMAGLAEMWCEYLFPLISLYDFTFTDATNFQMMRPSLIARNTREAKIQRITIKQEIKSRELQKEEDKREARKKNRGKKTGKSPRSLSTDPRGPKSIGKKGGAIIDNTVFDSGSKSTDEKSNDPNTKGYDEDTHAPLEDFRIQLEDIVSYATEALNIGKETSDLFLLLRGYLVMAEAQKLIGAHDIALEFWVAFKNGFCSLFVEEQRAILREGPPNILERLLNLLSSALRFLFTLNKDQINVHLDIIDIYNNLQVDLEVALRRLNYFTQMKQPLPDTGSSKSSRKSTLKGTFPSVFGKPKNSIPSKTDDTLQLDKWSQSCSVLWGLLSFLQRQTSAFTEGKMSISDLRDGNQKCLRKLRLTAGHIRSGNLDKIKSASISSTFQHQQNMRSLLPVTMSGVSPGPERALSIRRPQPKKQTTTSDPTPSTKVLDHLVYIIELNSNIIYYCARNGEMSIQRMGSTTNTFTGPSPKHTLYIEICFPSRNESLTLAVSPDITLSDVRNYICTRSHWELQPEHESADHFLPGMPPLQPFLVAIFLAVQICIALILV